MHAHPLEKVICILSILFFGFLIGIYLFFENTVKGFWDTEKPAPFTSYHAADDSSDESGFVREKEKKQNEVAPIVIDFSSTTVSTTPNGECTLSETGEYICE